MAVDSWGRIYTTKSTYQIQFDETFSKIRITPIWKGKTEPKCNFFAWTLLHKKILTANNLNKCNWQNEPICKLCGTDPETPTHLCKHCTCTKDVWELIKQWLGLSTLNQINMTRSLHNYWWKCRAKIEWNQRQSFDGILESWSTSGGAFGRSGIKGFFNIRIYSLEKWQCYARMTYNVFYD